MLTQFIRSCSSALRHLIAAAAGGGSRGFSSASALQTATRDGVVEIRRYTIHPSNIQQYLEVSKQHADLRKQLLPFLGMFTCDTGAELNTVTHFYHYQDLDERDAVRAAAAATPAWRQYITTCRPWVQGQESCIMREAWPVYDAVAAPGAASFKPPTTRAGNFPVVYELRQYQLHPGYGSVPKLVEAFTQGLPDKVGADREGGLALFAFSDVGLLNSVVELWRYPSAGACIRARQAARTVPRWRDTIAAVTPGVQHFRSSFLHPTSFSPWS